MTSEITVVVPCLNEAENLVALYESIQPVVESDGVACSFLFIDDGSTDETWDAVSDLVRVSPTVSGLRLSRNFGHEAAIKAGLDNANGDAVIVMDADLQDSPDGVASLIEAWRKGADIAYAVRLNRPEGALLRFAFWAYYRFAARAMSTNLPIDAGPFCLMSRRVVDAMREMDEYGRYFPGLRSFIGFNQVAVPVERGRRHHGQSKYGLVKRASLGSRAILSFSRLPLTFVVWVGLLASGLALVGGMVIVALTLSGGDVVPGWASLITAMLLFSGVQLLTLGVIGQYVGGIYEEVKKRPTYVVAEALKR